MKKVIMIVVVLFTTYGYSQKASKDYSFFDKSQQQEEDPATGAAPAEPGDAPIDDYIPALAAVGLGMAVYFGRKKYILTK